VPDADHESLQPTVLLLLPADVPVVVSFSDPASVMLPVAPPAPVVLSWLDQAVETVLPKVDVPLMVAV
jgi:hypothetical protein